MSLAVGSAEVTLAVVGSVVTVDDTVTLASVETVPLVGPPSVVLGFALVLTVVAPVVGPPLPSELSPSSPPPPSTTGPQASANITPANQVFAVRLVVIARAIPMCHPNPTSTQS